MQEDCTPCPSCASLRQQIEALRKKNHALEARLSRLRSRMPNGDALRVCRVIARQKPERFHVCGVSLPLDVRAALQQESCRLMPEIGAGAIILTRCEYLRIIRLIEQTDTCWLWRGNVGALGYGVIGWDDRRWPAHRFIYTLFRGAIPYGLALDHTCRVKHCVNPAHLDAVTQGENIRRHHGVKLRSA